MNLRRNIGVTNPPIPITAPTAPPTVSAPPAESARPALPSPPPPKPSQEKISPFSKGFLEKPSKLRALEASGSNGYVLVSSPTVCDMPMWSGPCCAFVCLK